MEPTVWPGDDLLIIPATTCQRGNIVVFSPPAGWSEGAISLPFIKRVIGLAGDTVEVKDGAIFLNGTRLNEPYVYENQPTTAAAEPARWVVPAGQVFVLGDHRGASADSRSFGTVAVSSLLGVAVRRCSPSEAPPQ